MLLHGLLHLRQRHLRQVQEQHPRQFSIPLWLFCLLGQSMISKRYAIVSNVFLRISTYWKRYVGTLKTAPFHKIFNLISCADTTKKSQAVLQVIIKIASNFPKRHTSARAVSTNSAVSNFSHISSKEKWCNFQHSPKITPEKKSSEFICLNLQEEKHGSERFFSDNESHKSHSNSYYEPPPHHIPYMAPPPPQYTHKTMMEVDFTPLFLALLPMFLVLGTLLGLGKIWNENNSWCFLVNSFILL